MERRQLTIVVADVVGYSRLMQADEDATYAKLIALRRDLIEPSIAMYGGEYLKNTGDGFIATFSNPQDAVLCSLAVQQASCQEAGGGSAADRIQLRIGVNVADVIVEPGDVYGAGVNIAARLQSFAVPGGIVLPRELAALVERGPDVHLHDLGELPLRNIQRPVEAVSLSFGDPSVRRLGEVARGAEQRPFIAVLPFVEDGVPADQAYFSSGIVDDIIHALAGLKELFVLSRGASLGLDPRERDIRRIGAELGVRYILHGSIQRSGSRIRIRTELNESATGAVLFSDRQDGVLDELFDLQSKIALRVVATLAPQIRERERNRALRQPPANLTAYDYLLQALDPLFQMDPVAFARAKGLLQHAIASDPEYGPAHSYSAYWHLLRVGQGWSTDPRADTAEASEHAEAAIARDETDALALAIFGHVHSYLLKDFETATELQERALECGPSCAMAWTLSSVTQGYLGVGPEAVFRAITGLKLSPRGPHVVYHEHVLSQAYYVNGNYDEAVRWALRANKHNARLTSNVRCLIASLVALDLLDEARDHGARLLQLDPGFRLSAFGRQTPLPGTIKDNFLDRLRRAGLPE
jgi:adenylate cyclase